MSCVKYRSYNFLSFSSTLGTQEVLVGRCELDGIRRRSESEYGRLVVFLGARDDFLAFPLFKDAFWCWAEFFVVGSCDEHEECARNKY